MDNAGGKGNCPKSEVPAKTGENRKQHKGMTEGTVSKAESDSDLMLGGELWAHSFSSSE